MEHTSTTPLYYAQIATVTGICFQIGETVLFAPCEQETILMVNDVTALVVTAKVPPLMERFLTETVVEKRLERLGRGR